MSDNWGGRRRTFAPERLGTGRSSTVDMALFYFGIVVWVAFPHCSGWFYRDQFGNIECVEQVGEGKGGSCDGFTRELKGGL